MGKQRKPQGINFVDLHFPLGGLNRATAFQSQPPYTTPFCQNVRPFDPILQRQRGGSRPGLTDIFGLALGGPFQLLDSFASVSGPGLTNNYLLWMAGGTLQASLIGGSPQTAPGWVFNNSATSIQGAQVGATYYYIADYRPGAILSGKDGSIASTTHLSASSVADWTTLGITPGTDVVYVAHSDAFIGNNPSKTYASGTIAIDGGIATLTFGSTPKWNRYMVGGSLTVPNVETLVIEGYISTTQLAVSDVTLTVAGGTAYEITYSYDSENSIFAIASVSNGYIVLGADISGNAPGSNGAGINSGDTALTWQIGRSPQQYNVATNTLGPLYTNVTFGIPPLGCPLCCNYRGRLVLAGPGEVWYMSRVNDATDWDFGADPGDVQRAVGGADSTNGNPSAPITALMPHSDQFLVIACVDSLWVLTGDPGYGGQLQNLSRDIGCVGPSAWCNLPDGSILFLSRDGLYSISGGQNYPAPVSLAALPADLREIDLVSNTISMSYDTFRRGARISVTPTGMTLTGVTTPATAGLYTDSGITYNGYPVLHNASTGFYISAGINQSIGTTWYLTDAVPTGIPNYIFGGPSYTNTPGGAGSYVAQGGPPPSGTSVAVGTTQVNGTHYWFDTSSSTFWLDVYAASAIQPTAQLRFNPLQPGQRTLLLLGGFDGHLRYVNDAETTDDLNNFVSFVTYGPIRPGGVGYEALLMQLSVDLDSASQNVIYAIHANTTAQAVVNDMIAGNTPQATGTFASGYNRRAYPRVNGPAMAITLSSNSRWAIEGMRVSTRRTGVSRNG